MSIFFDLEPEEEPKKQRDDLRELLTRIPIAQPATRLHPDVSDRLAEQHGFTSREPAASRFVGGRRQPRGVPVEQTRQLSIRMPVSLFEEFIQFADTHKLTYNEAIRALLDRQ